MNENNAKLPTSPGHNPSEGHRHRLRLKFLEHGLAKFTDEEILELLLTLNTPRQDCKQRARELLRHFGNLAYVLEADQKELETIKGIGPKNILGLKLIPAVARRYLQNKMEITPFLHDYDQITDYLRLSMASLTHEVFHVISLNSQRRVLADENIFRGTINQAPVYPRDVLDTALRRGATALICAHNHPSGDVRPGQSDQALTRKLYFACRASGVELLDHLIVGRDKIYSFAQAGHMANLEREFMKLGL